MPCDAAAKPTCRWLGTLASGQSPGINPLPPGRTVSVSDMDLFVWVLLAVVGIHFVNKGEQSRRIALLGKHLGHYHVENLMEQVTEGYLRALDTTDPDRRDQIWAALTAAEQELAKQFSRFVADFAGVYGEHARVSRLPFAFPRAAQVFPRASFDLRMLLAVHGNAIVRIVANDKGLNNRDKAFVLTAELYLMQHSCHWFCQSKNVASARLLLRHKTSYEQVLEAVSDETREAYIKVIHTP